MRDGTQKAVHVQHAIGSLQRPLTDADLERKFTSLAAPVLGERSLAPLIASLWALGHAPDVRDVTALAVPAA
jgi:2-methylcitrate dehydratase PrpD